jgi:murein L,D-transpeptidase YafK
MKFTNISMYKSALIVSAAMAFCVPMTFAAAQVDVINSRTFNVKFSTHQTEDLLVKSLLQITQGQLQQAADSIDQVLKIAPNFKLAQLVRGDLLMARAHQFQTFGSVAINAPEHVADFREEARKRIEHYLSQQKNDNLPEPLWQLDAQQQYAIVVDADNSRLYLYRNENGLAKYVADFYTTIGKNGLEKRSEGDKRTPLGVYFTGVKLTQKLADIYGDAAYPLSYPNEWDRRQGKTGSGIWVHGTPQDTYSRPPNASDGCVVVSNPDLDSMAPVLQKGNVPVVIAQNLKWISPQELPAKKSELLNALETWRKDWQSQNTDVYLSHYSQQFASNTSTFEQWVTEKRRIQSSKPKVDIKLSNISMFNYPNSSKLMVMVMFDQSFKNAVLDSQMRKRQYWVYENQGWKIIYEGPA